MSRIVLDPDDVNQDRHVTMTDGTVVELSDADRRMLDRIARQLHVHRSTYQHAFRSDDPELEQSVAAGERRVEDVAALYLRVAALQQAARQGRARAAEELDVSMLFQTRIWTSSAGTTRPLTDLTPTHRRNLIAWLERHGERLHERAVETGTAAMAAPDETWIAGTPLYRRLQELVAAESGRDEAIDRARQIVRRLEFERSGEWPEA